MDTTSLVQMQPTDVMMGSLLDLLDGDKESVRHQEDGMDGLNLVTIILLPLLF